MLVHKIFHKVKNFVNKIHEVPCCRRRRLPLWEYVSDFYAHRVSRVIYRTRVVTNPEGRQLFHLNGISNVVVMGLNAIITLQV